MTLATANIQIKLALPQGWTKEQIEDLLNDVVAVAEQDLQDRASALAETDVDVVSVNADPFFEKVVAFPRTLSVTGIYPLSMR